VERHAVLGLVAVVVLAVVHVGAERMRFVQGPPRSRALSAGGGISVAYVFVHLLPEIAEGQHALAETAEGLLPFLERHAHLLALLGLSLFYGLERGAVVSRRRHGGGEGSAEAGFFGLHLAAFALYNALIGYLLVLRAGEREVADLVLFTVALGVHLVVNDAGLRGHHQHKYDHVGRWILAGALLVGWGVGAVTTVSEAALAALVALLGGAVVLNVLKEELPAERESRFWAFALGAGGYTVLLLLV
jgi:hypothetical protein